MAVPAGGEIAIYNADAKEHQWRLISGLDFPAWTAEKSETFSGALDSGDFWHTQFLQSAPDVSGGSLNIKSYGSPLRELVVTRPHWFPTTDIDSIGYKATVNATFPLTGDPVYSPMIIFGSIGPSAVKDENLYLGHLDDALHVVQLGEAFKPGAVGPGGEIIRTSFGGRGFPVGNDGLSHEYEVEWDPDGSPKITVRIDGVERNTTSSVSLRPPRYISFGGMWQSTEEASPDKIKGVPGSGKNPPLGTPDNPVTVLKIHDITVTQHAAEGYETRSYPGWTSANAGGDIDDAVDGERFALDGETWAKIPQANIEDISVSRLRTGGPDTISVRLRSGDSFVPSRMVNRPLLLDTRVSDEVTFTAWKRQGCFIIERVESEDDTIIVTGRDRPSKKLDTFFSKTYLSVNLSTDQSGERDVDEDLTWTEVFEDLIAVSDAVQGDLLGPTDKTVFAPELSPAVLSTGGQSLLPTMDEWTTRLVMESFRKYATSGTNRYGGWRVYSFVHGSGTGGYTFTGRGGTGSSVVAGGNRLITDSAQGPAAVYYRNDNPVQPGTVNDFISAVPVLGNYPIHPWPPEGRVLDDSISRTVGIAGLLLSPLTPWRDENGADVNGSISFFRYRRENLQMRKIQLTVSGHDWLEPTDEITFNDPDGTGILTATGSWVVEDITLTIGNGTIISVFTAHTSDLDAALLEVL